MTTLKLAAAVAVLLATTAHAQQKQELKIDSFRLYAYDANGNTTDYKYTKSISAKRHSYHKGAGAVGGSGNVFSKKTGASARVGAEYAAKFQAYIDDLEANGAAVRFMGGIRRGKCWSGGMHPCGRALDVCQLSRGRVDSRCHLPSRRTIAAIAERHGLFEGGQWCDSDYGHVQVGVSAATCGSGSNYAAHKRHRHTRVATQGNALPQATTYNFNNY